MGKGTYGALLEKDLNFYKVTPGDIIRKQIKNSNDSTNPLVKKLKNTIDQGKLVEDDLV